MRETRRSDTPPATAWPVDGLGDVDVVSALLDELARGPTKARATAITVELGDERLVHQGAWSPAAPHAVAALVVILEGPAVAKEEILLVLAQIAAGSPSAHWEGCVVGDLALAALDARGPDEVVGACRRAVGAARAAIAACLVDRRAIVRAAAALLLGLLPPADESVASVHARFAKEKDERARGALHLTLATWQRAYGLAIDAALVDPEEAKPFAATCRAVARSLVPGPGVDADRDVLVAAALTPPKGFDATKDLPISTRRFAFAALIDAYPDAARSAGIRGLESGAFGAKQLVESFYPVPRGVEAWADLPRFDELPSHASTLLRDVLSALPRKPLDSWIDGTLAKPTGLPSVLGDARRWAGLDPPGPLEVEVAGQVDGMAVAWPAWRWLRRVAIGRVSRDDLVVALRAHRDPEEVLRIAIEACSGHVYDLFYVGAWSWIDSVHLGVEVLGARDDAEAALRAALVTVAHGWGPLVVTAALARIVGRRGEPLPEEADRHVAGQCEAFPQLVPLVRDLLRSIPSARRDAIVDGLTLPVHVNPTDHCWNVRVGPRARGWAFLDLASDRARAAERAVSAVAAWTQPPPRQRVADEEAIAALLRLAGLGPEARSAIDAASSSATDVGRAVLERARAALDARR